MVLCLVKHYHSWMSEERTNMAAAEDVPLAPLENLKASIFSNLV